MRAALFSTAGAIHPQSDIPLLSDSTWVLRRALMPLICVQARKHVELSIF